MDFLTKSPQNPYKGLFLNNIFFLQNFSVLFHFFLTSFPLIRIFLLLFRCLDAIYILHVANQLDWRRNEDDDDDDDYVSCCTISRYFSCHAWCFNREGKWISFLLNFSFFRTRNNIHADTDERNCLSIMHNVFLLSRCESL